MTRYPGGRRSRRWNRTSAKCWRHGPAYCQAYGRFIGAIIMMFAIAKARRGPVGIATAVTLVGGIAYHLIWR